MFDDLEACKEENKTLEQNAMYRGENKLYFSGSKTTTEKRPNLIKL